MKNLESEPVPSPCRSLCQVDPTETFCTGCLRLLPEIFDWIDMSEDEKREVWKRILERRDKK